MPVSINYDGKSHTGFRLILTWMTLNDLERRNSPYVAFFSPNLWSIFMHSRQLPKTEKGHTDLRPVLLASQLIRET